MKITNADHKIWFCQLCNEGCECKQVKVFPTICKSNPTAKGDTSIVLQAANKLNPNLQLTLKIPKENSGLAFFLDINLKVDGNKQVNCES